MKMIGKRANQDDQKEISLANNMTWNS